MISLESRPTMTCLSFEVANIIFPLSALFQNTHYLFEDNPTIWSIPVDIIWIHESSARIFECNVV